MNEPLERLTEHSRRLPGVGVKTARRFLCTLFWKSRRSRWTRLLSYHDRESADQVFIAPCAAISPPRIPVNFAPIRGAIIT